MSTGLSTVVPIDDGTIREALEDAPRTAKEVAAFVGAPTREVRGVLRTLVDRGVVYPCANHRFWTQDEMVVLTTAARKKLTHKPATRSQLCTALTRVGTGASRAYLQRLVKKLRDEPDIYVWPPHGAHRAERLAMTPPDLGLYLRRTRSELQPVVTKLDAVGTPPAAIAAALFPDLPSPPGDHDATPTRPARSPLPEPSDQAELDFHRETSAELVFAWEDAVNEPATREALAGVMFNMGLQRLGETGMEVPFEGVKHETDDDLLPGDLAVVVEPGWELQRGNRSRVVGRARVRAAGSAA